MKLTEFKFNVFVFTLVGLSFVGGLTKAIWDIEERRIDVLVNEQIVLNNKLDTLQIALTTYWNELAYMPVPDRQYTTPMNPDDFRGYTSPFGIRLDPTKNNIGGLSQTNHRGEDMRGTPDALVVSIGVGVVITKWYSRGYHKVNGKMKWFSGNNIFDGYVVIKHSNGDESEYGHLDEIYVHEGTEVVAGTPIGRVSQKLNGKTTGPHLHFALRNKLGVYLPPFRYVRMPREVL